MSTSEELEFLRDLAETGHSPSSTLARPAELLLITYERFGKLPVQLLPSYRSNERNSDQRGYETSLTSVLRQIMVEEAVVGSEEIYWEPSYDDKPRPHSRFVTRSSRP